MLDFTSDRLWIIPGKWWNNIFITPASIKTANNSTLLPYVDHRNDASWTPPWCSWWSSVLLPLKLIKFKKKIERNIKYRSKLNLLIMPVYLPFVPCNAVVPSETCNDASNVNISNKVDSFPMIWSDVMYHIIKLNSVIPQKPNEETNETISMSS